MLNKISEIIQTPELNLSKNDNYLKSYPHILNHFNKLDTMDQGSFIVGANLVYGWMPTTFKLKGEFERNINDAIGLLNKAKNERKSLELEELSIVKSVVNNSMVGASKLLHFINPDLYPIWDSRICDVCLEKSYNYLVSDPSNYVKYQSACSQMILKDEFKVPYEEVLKALASSGYVYGVTKMRAIEMILFNYKK